MSPAPSPRNVLGLLGAFVATSVVAGLLAAGLAMPAVGASGLATKNSVNFFDSLPGDLARPPLSEQSTLLAADGTKITTFYDENRVTVDLDQISPNMQHAIVAIEDARFYQHGGVDPKGLVRAFMVNQISGTVEQGASTLTQQYVKNVLKETAHAKGDEAGVEAAQEKSNARKLKEIRFAVTLEKTLTKPQILNNYLNIAWFGGQINGVEAAAKYYFNTTALKLTLAQSATLAGMIQSPVDYSPKNNPTAALQRRNLVLTKMLEQHMIDQATYDATQKTKLGARITPNLQGCANASYRAYFCDYVYRLITQSNAFSGLGKTQEERTNTLLRGGLTIRTTMDPKVEAAAWKATSGTISTGNKAATAAVTVEAGTGKVLSIAQNKVYGGGSSAKTTINYSVDGQYGGGSGFQTGSTFKPFTLATWLKAGKSLNATVDGTPSPAPYSSFKSCGSPVRGKTYIFGNSADGRETGPMSVWSATAESVNGAYVNMEKQLDLCDIRQTAESLGVHLAAGRPDDCSPVRPRPSTKRLPNCIPSLTLGVEDISPMTMAAAYAGFAASGKFCSPIAVTSITDRDGKPVRIPTANCKQTLDEKVANTVNLGLSKVFSPGGTGYRIGGLPNGRPASGKTGTTNNSVDTWFVGYTRQLATAVWVGDPHTYKVGRGYERKSMNGRTINGQHFGSIFGATLAGPIWKKIMVAASKGMEIKRFPAADSKLLVSPKSNVPDVRGKSIPDAIAILKHAGFKPVAGGFAPSKYPVGSVASTSPDSGSQLSKGSTITITISAGGGDGPGGGGNGGGGNGGGPGPQ
jgi:membrane peptidoglycan carboxypeptidase